MEIKAVQKTTRQTPLKVRLVANAVRKLPIPQAISQLAVMERRASLLVLKVLRQAIANAQHNHRLSIDQLKIKSILVNEGPRYKRFNAVSRGRGHAILKRTCHLTVILESLDTDLGKKELPQPKKEQETSSKTGKIVTKTKNPKKNLKSSVVKKKEIKKS